MAREYRKIKIKKTDQPVIEFMEADSEGTDVDVIKAYRERVHPDFNAAMDGLALHLAVLTGYTKREAVKDKDFQGISTNFVVRGFSIGGFNEDEGIVISGHVILPSGKAVILNSPFERFNDESPNAYPFMHLLLAQLIKIKDEANKFMDGEKFYPKEQLEMEMA